MPCSEMGMVRLSLALLCIAGFVACATSAPEPPPKEEELGEAPRVPNPPPKYPRSGTASGPVSPDPDGGGDLQIKCGGYKPYVCTLDDGTFVCSDRPCVPDCSRVGCIGGEVCVKCEGGFVCMPPGSGC